MKGGEKGVSFRSVVLWLVILALLGSRPAGAAITATGNIDPNYTGADPWDVGGDLKVGSTADGALAITGGSQVIHEQGRIGANVGTTGSVSITGAGSSWQGQLFVGDHGSGTLSVSGGATLTAQYVSVGNEAGSVGHFTLDGPGTTWQGIHDMIIHLDGSPATAEEEAQAPIVIYANIGKRGTGDMTVSGGARVVSEGGQLKVGYFRTGIGTLTVTGPNSVWVNTGSTYIGYMGKGTLVISDGASVTSGQTSIGGDTFAGEGSVLVTGSNSLWRTGASWDGLSIGSNGPGELTISAGGRVESLYANIGGVMGTVTVTGLNSVWTNSGSLYVGGNSAGDRGQGRLTVRDSGLVEAHDLTIWSPGTIDGDGTVRATNIVNHGTIRPGNSIGTMTIDGNLKMDSGSVLETEIDNSGHSDKLAVTGNVEIVHGTVKVVPTETVTAEQQYTIVEANSINGRFDSVDATLIHVSSPIRVAELGYEPNAVLLDIRPATFSDPAFGQTRNEKQMASVLQRMSDSGGNAITSAVGDLHTYTDVRHAYDQLSGQTRAPLAFVASENQERYMSLVSGRLHSAAGVFAEGSSLPGMFAVAGSAGENAASATPFGVANDMTRTAGPCLFELGNGTPNLGDQPWGIWGRGYGSGGDRETKDGIPGYNYATYGTCFGVDYRFSPQWLMGVTTGFSRGSVDHARSADMAFIDTTHVGFYGSYEQPGEYIDFIGDYGDQDYHTRRYVDVLDERLDGHFGGSVAGGYVEAGLKRSWGPLWILQPLASFQIVWADLDRFNESGGAARLAFDDQQFQSYKGSLGAKAARLLYENDDGSKAAVELRGRWLHEFGDVRSTVGADFVSNPALGFNITDAAAPRDSALLGVGLDAWFSQALRGFLDYDVELNQENCLQVLSAGLLYRW